MTETEAPTSTKWVDVRKMLDDGEEFMRSRLVARDFRPRRGPDRPDLFAAMLPLEAKKMLFFMTVAGSAFEQRGSKDEQKLMFIDVRKAHLNGVVDDQEWVFVELPTEFHVYGRFCEDQALAVWHEEGGFLVGKELRGEAGRSRLQGESACADDLLQSSDQGETRGARR